jgi:hypothetical protein
MNTIRWKFREIFPECHVTFGNETFVKRNELRLEKTHFNDAFVIAGGINQMKVSPVFLGQKHRNNRVMQLNRKGFKPSIRRHRYSIQPYDLVAVNGERHTVKGCSTYGKFVVCYGNKSFSINKIKKVFHTGSIYLK